MSNDSGSIRPGSGLMKDAVQPRIAESPARDSRTSPSPVRTTAPPSAAASTAAPAADAIDTPGQTRRLRSTPATTATLLLANEEVSAAEQHLVDRVIGEAESDVYDDLRSKLAYRASVRDAITARQGDLSRLASMQRSGGEGGLLAQPIFRADALNDSGQPTAAAQTALENFETARANLANAENAQTTGSGFSMLSGAEAARLDPPGVGTVFLLNSGMRIDANPDRHEVKIYQQDGENWDQVVRIWGDPHVDEAQSGAGDDWHFGEDSTFVLPDGSKLFLNTEEIRPGVFVTKGVDLQSGEQRGFVGLGLDGTKRAPGVSNDRVAYDSTHHDTQGDSGGVFALQTNGQWAKQGADGNFRDVQNESWKGYLADKDVDTGSAIVEVNAQQINATDLNGLAATQEAQAVLKLATEELSNYAWTSQDQVESAMETLQREIATLHKEADRFTEIRPEELSAPTRPDVVAADLTGESSIGQDPDAIATDGTVRLVQGLSASERPS